MNNQLGSIAVSRAWAVALVVFGGFVLGAGGSAQANLLTNGGFETGTDPNVGNGGIGFLTVDAGATDITGWTVGGASVDYIGIYWQPGEGSRSIDLSGSHDVGGNEWGSLSQTFATTAGTTYTVSFLLAGNPDGGPEPKTADVTVNLDLNTYTFDATGQTHSDMGWVLKSFSFLASGPSSTITFASDPVANNTFFGPALDDVDISAAVPTPGTLPLFAAGLGMMAWFVWRSKRKAAGGLGA